MLLPWLVGACMKLYLDAQGQPTFSWSYFLSPAALPFLIILSFWWGLPMIAIAVFAHTALLAPGTLFSYGETLIIILFTACFGFAGMVKAFIPIFRSFDPLYGIVPVFFYYFHWIIGGFLLGLFVAYLRVLWRTHYHQ